MYFAVTPTTHTITTTIWAVRPQPARRSMQYIHVSCNKGHVSTLERAFINTYVPHANSVIERGTAQIPLRVHHISLWGEGLSLYSLSLEILEASHRIALHFGLMTLLRNLQTICLFSCVDIVYQYLPIFAMFLIILPCFCQLYLMYNRPVWFSIFYCTMSFVSYIVVHWSNLVFFFLRPVGPSL